MLFKGEPRDPCDSTEGALLLFPEEGLGFSVSDLEALLVMNLMG